MLCYAMIKYVSNKYRYFIIELRLYKPKYSVDNPYPNLRDLGSDPTLKTRYRVVPRQIVLLSI